MYKSHSLEGICEEKLYNFSISFWNQLDHLAENCILCVVFVSACIFYLASLKKLKIFEQSKSLKSIDQTQIRRRKGSHTLVIFGNDFIKSQNFIEN